MMLKRMTALLLVVFGVVALCGCDAGPMTVTLNSGDEPGSQFVYAGSLFEATVRELTVDGNEATARIRVKNISGYPVDGVGARVEFLDEAGSVLYVDNPRIQFEVALENGEGVTLMAQCSGRDVEKIVTVVVADA